MALDYYEKKTGYRPSQVSSDVNQDGTVSIQLYDNMGDHNSTSAWYTVDPKTAVGTDIMENKIDLNHLLFHYPGIMTINTLPDSSEYRSVRQIAHPVCRYPYQKRWSPQ